MDSKQNLAVTLKQFQTELDSDQLTAVSIAELQEKLAGYSLVLRQEAARTKYQEALAAAKAMGFESLSELEQRVLNPTAPVIKKRVVKPVYRNPDAPSETWAGRGKQPRWLKAKIDGGAQVADFRIANGD